MNYDVVTKSAKDAVKFFKNDDKKYIQAMRTFYTQGKKNPSVARIIMQNEIVNNASDAMIRHKTILKEIEEFRPDYSTEMPSTLLNMAHNSILMQDVVVLHGKVKTLEMMNNAFKMFDSLNILGKESPTEVSSLKTKFDESFDKLYPRTGNVRKNIAQFHIRMDKVKPKLKADKKRIILEPEKGYLALYPKTYYTRLMLAKSKKSLKDMNWIEKLKFSKIFKSFGQKKSGMQAVNDALTKTMYALNK